jgi:hypothetical protein
VRGFNSETQGQSVALRILTLSAESKGVLREQDGETVEFIQDQELVDLL